MRYYAVIDTNVLVSALLRFASVPGIVAQEALSGRIIPLLNDEIVREYREVLLRCKFHFNRTAVDAIINGIIKRGVFIDANPTDEPIIDPKDAVFYEVVMKMRQADEAYLVTGNLKHFPVKHFIVTPREMLDILENGE